MQEPRLALWVYRMLLRLYPAQFRQDYEREVVSAFRRQWEWQARDGSSASSGALDGGMHRPRYADERSAPCPPLFGAALFTASLSLVPAVESTPLSALSNCPLNPALLPA
jgi:hypothetical protein